MDQTVRQQARARARQARAKVRQEQAKRERRLAKWGEQVTVALAERDAVVTDCEQRAGQALRSLIKDEGLSTREALAWCGDEGLTGREAYRLIRAATEDRDQDAPVAAWPAESMTRGEVEPPVAAPTDRAGPPPALRAVNGHDLLAPAVHRHATRPVGTPSAQHGRMFRTRNPPAANDLAVQPPEPRVSQADPYLQRAGGDIRRHGVGPGNGVGAVQRHPS